MQQSLEKARMQILKGQSKIMISSVKNRLKNQLNPDQANTSKTSTPLASAKMQFCTSTLRISVLPSRDLLKSLRGASLDQDSTCPKVKPCRIMKRICPRNRLPSWAASETTFSWSSPKWQRPRWPTTKETFMPVLLRSLARKNLSGQMSAPEGSRQLTTESQEREHTRCPTPASLSSRTTCTHQCDRGSRRALTKWSAAQTPESENTATSTFAQSQTKSSKVAPATTSFFFLKRTLKFDHLWSQRCLA